MEAKPQHTHTADYYFGFLKNLQHDTKLDLITKLSESLKTTEKQETTSLQSLFGAYQLPTEKTEEIADFAEFVVKQYEEHKLTEGIQRLTANSQAFDFLNDEEELYSEADLKEVYHA